MNAVLCLMYMMRERSNATEIAKLAGDLELASEKHHLRAKNLADDPKHAAMLGERFAKRLWDAGRKVDALELAQRCRKLSPSFAPPAAFTAELARYAREIGRHRLADDLTELAAAARPSAT